VRADGVRRGANRRLEGHRAGFARGLAPRQWLVKGPWAAGDTTTALAAHGGSLNLANGVAIALVEAWRQVDFAGAT
jgi:hypothetical protein